MDDAINEAQLTLWENIALNEDNAEEKLDPCVGA